MAQEGSSVDSASGSSEIVPEPDSNKGSKEAAPVANSQGQSRGGSGDRGSRSGGGQGRRLQSEAIGLVRH